MERLNESKQVIIGRSSLSSEFLEGLHSSVIYGINIYTDSDEMNDCCRLLEIHTQEIPNIHNSGINFFYLTKKQLPFINSHGQSLQQLSRNYPGDIYMSPDMSNFYFYGINKFGTLISMIYGIHAINQIKNGILGIHSALVYDQLNNQSHLLVGKSRIGKSSIGQLLEEHDPRFIMLSDDWNCVDISRNVVIPFSVVFSPQNPSPNYVTAFQSFGKSFYWKSNIGNFKDIPLGKIIELYDEDRFSQANEFWRQCMSHVPLLSQPISMATFDKPHDYTEIDLDRFHRIQYQFMVTYNQLTHTHQTRRVVNRKGIVPIEVAFQEVLNCFNEGK